MMRCWRYVLMHAAAARIRNPMMGTASWERIMPARIWPAPPGCQIAIRRCTPGGMSCFLPKLRIVCHVHMWLRPALAAAMACTLPSRPAHGIYCHPAAERLLGIRSVT